MNTRVYVAALWSVMLSTALMPSTVIASKRATKQVPARTEQPVAHDADGVAEARLIEIYKLIGLAKNREALLKAEKLTTDLPNFQLAQLVYGDLLVAQTKPIKAMGDVPQQISSVAGATLNDLRDESLRRITALRDRPPQGTIPSQFLSLAPRTKHAIAVDASRSRLYFFENTANGLNLVADYYISVGKSGTSKSVEGDDRTPLGVYYITSNLDPKSLKDFYGSGALPINYPNVLDTKRGKTGSGIWIHGTPSNQYSRPPQSTNGCIVLTNPDLRRIIRSVEVRTTPVVIATQLQWVAPQSTRAEGKQFEETLGAWRNAKTSGNLQQVLTFYTPDFTSNGKSLTQWSGVLQNELAATQGRTIYIKDLSYLRWVDASDTMVVTFGEVVDGSRNGLTKRQYWMRQNNQWKIFFEGII
jgi:L,D-transpeptidase YnhG